jgi:hypothetical protein
MGILGALSFVLGLRRRACRLINSRTFLCVGPADVLICKRQSTTAECLPLALSIMDFSSNSRNRTPAAFSKEGGLSSNSRALFA